jgi:hypothetical protein
MRTLDQREAAAVKRQHAAIGARDPIARFGLGEIKAGLARDARADLG